MFQSVPEEGEARRQGFVLLRDDRQQGMLVARSGTVDDVDKVGRGEESSGTLTTGTPRCERRRSTILRKSEVMVSWRAG